MTNVKSKPYALTVLVVTVMVLFLPFITKPFNIDDPLFIWAAKHILNNPFDFYGFSVNWYTKAEPMASITKNPPLFSYYLAGVGYLFGWNEVSMHLAVMIPLIALVVGTYKLAGQLTVNPLLASLIAVCTPAVMVSGATVMCDVPMVAFWVWAVYFWIEGCNSTDKPRYLIYSGLFISAACFTKYFGASLVPLLASYSIMRRMPYKRWLPYLCVPVLLFLLYEYATRQLYGIGLLSEAFAYSHTIKQSIKPGHMTCLIDGLSFVGGGFIIVLFFSPLLFKLRQFTLYLVGIAILTIVCHGLHIDPGSTPDWGFAFQQSAFIMTACMLIYVAVSDFTSRRDDASLLLLFWVLGTFLFASEINWTINERVVLPMAPAVGILIARRVAFVSTGALPIQRIGCIAALFSALSLSFLLTLADYRWSAEMLKVTQKIPSFIHSSKQHVWFQGHWGFQYYMENIAGASPVDFSSTTIGIDDLMVTPNFGSDIIPISSAVRKHVDVIPTAPLSWLTVMHPLMGAGFYSSTFGHLPYAFGRVKPESYYVISFSKEVRFNMN